MSYFDRLKGGNNILNQRKTLALQALLSTSTLKAAADKAGISAKTLYRYLHEDEEFKAALSAEMSTLISKAKDNLQKAMLPASGALGDMVSGERQADANKISACRAIFDYALKLTEIEDILKRIETLERSSNEQRNN